MDEIMSALLEGCRASLAAFQDGTKSKRRIEANISYLTEVIADAEQHIAQENQDGST